MDIDPWFRQPRYSTNRKYMEILRSLAPGGRRHYAPSIPFIEDLLPVERYRVTRERIDGEFMRSVVEARE